MIYILQQCSNSKASLILRLKKKKQRSAFYLFTVSALKTLLFGKLCWLWHYIERSYASASSKVFCFQRKKVGRMILISCQKRPVLYRNTAFMQTVPSALPFSLQLYTFWFLKLHIKKIEQWGFFDIKFWSDFRNSNNHVVRPAS